MNKQLCNFIISVQGRITYKNGDQFTGEFCDNDIEGTGELRCVSGLTYKGEWKHSKVSIKYNCPVNQSAH